jgi:hypothetical protein
MKKNGTVGLAQIAQGKLPLNVIQFPTGTWGFVGRVPAALAHVMTDGSPVTAEAAKIAASFGPALANVKTRAWETREAAVAAAQDLGFDVSE